MYSRRKKLLGEADEDTLIAANNYAASLLKAERFEKAKSLLRKTMPVARRVLGDGHRLTLKMRKIYSQTLYVDDGATLDDLHEAVTTLEDTERTARRVMGGAHPTTAGIEKSLRLARAALHARRPVLKIRLGGRRRRRFVKARAETPPAGDTTENGN